MGDLLQPWHLLVLVMIFSSIAVPIRVLPFWFICKKAGFPPWLSLLYLIPLGGLVLNFVLAFGDWKPLPAPQSGWQQTTTYPPQA
jgi:hypothetical protein